MSSNLFEMQLQQRLKDLGFYQGPIDGVFGPVTLTAISSAMDLIEPARVPAAAIPAPSGVVPKAWMPTAEMERIIFHWTAGAHKATAFDREHYHILIEGDGKVIRGIPSIAANAAGGSGKRASHTLNCNTGSIGVSLCCMADAVERPLNVGKYPLTKEQWDKLSIVLAELCEFYKIPVTPKTVLSHAEVQGSLGIRQKGKWDIAILPFDQQINTPRECGDLMRKAVAARFQQ